MIRTIKTDRIYGNPNQPRQLFDAKALQELADSIVQNGLLQPIRVRPDADGRFMIVCGERRWRAHQLAGIPTIKAEVVTADALDDQSLAIAAIVENLQRADISPLEEARAYQRMLDSGLTTEELAKRLGIKQGWRITERTNLLKLGSDHQALLAKGVITPSQAQEMSRLSPANQDRLLLLIRDGQCDTYNRLRAAASALLETEQQTEMFAKPAPLSEDERKQVGHLEATIERLTRLVGTCIHDGEVVAARKAPADQAQRMAEYLAVMQKDLATIEKALRTAAIQRMAA